MERRYSTQRVQLQERAAGQLPLIVGYASVFYREDDPGTQYTLFPGLVERVEPSAFAKLAEDDVRALFNHEPTMVLGRAKAKTVKLSVDDTGLKYEIEPPDTVAGRDVLTSIRRGDVDGSSFAFRVRAEGVRWEEKPEYDVRVLTDLQVFDVGPVTYPAYEATTAGVRSALTDDEAIAQWRQWKEQRDAERDRVEKRLKDIQTWINTRS